MNRTLVHSTPHSLSNAALDGLGLTAYDRGLAALKPGRRSGALTSAVQAAVFPFSRLIVSVSAELPRGSELRLEARTARRGRWSGWKALGRLDASGGASVENAGVDVDVLALERPADAFQYRLRFKRGRGGSPLLKLVAAAYGDGRTRPGRAARARRGLVYLDVEPRSQMVEHPSYRSDICSPTSLGMVMDYWGWSVPTAELSASVRDRRAGIYGNWVLNAAWAGRGLDAYVARMDSLEELEDELRGGRPVICSVAFGKGELPGAPIAKTRGHLLVVRGMDEKGDILAQDPAASLPGEVSRTYPRSAFARAWLKNKQGVAYLLARRFPKELSVAVPAADLRRRPAVVSGRRDKDQESQLLLGERVRVLKAEGSWCLVDALDQATEHGPYRGWVCAGALAASPGPCNRVVAAPTLELKAGKERLLLPAGALLRELGPGPRGLRRVLLPGDRPALAPASGLRPLTPLPAARARAKVLAMLRSFIGERYFWGGKARGSVSRGFDCSGVVGVAYRSAGYRLPRNAHDQWKLSRPVRRPLPGDLLFLSKQGDPSWVGHVMAYAGGGRLLEAEGDVDRVREVDFEAKVGVPFEQARSGGDYQGRRLYYGTFLDGSGSGPRAGGPRPRRAARRHPALRPPR